MKFQISFAKNRILAAFSGNNRFLSLLPALFFSHLPHETHLHSRVVWHILCVSIFISPFSHPQTIHFPLSSLESQSHASQEIFHESLFLGRITLNKTRSKLLVLQLNDFVSVSLFYGGVKSSLEDNGM